MFLKRLSYFVLLLFTTILFSQCSTKNNTWLSRNYQTFSTRFNVYFNAYESYKTGIDKISKGHVDNYTEVLPLFQISVHENASFGMSDMGFAIEKSEKAIRNRSIQRKPKRNPSRLQDPAYQAFLNQAEYNPMVEKSWLLMGMAQFHRADFVAANATFMYILRNYNYNTELETSATIWLARSYAELGWLYEADDLLNRLDESKFSANTNLLFVYTKADLLLKQKKYKEAIPFLETAFKTEKKSSQQARVAFILGQLYEKEMRYNDAFRSYNQVLKKNPPYSMAFNARLKKAQSYQGSDYEDIINGLNKLARKERNEDFLDQIYSAIAKLYQRNGKRDLAIAYYNKAIESSTRNGLDKAEALLSLGRLYYENREYIKAQPLINEAVPMLPANYTDYRNLRILSENLNELALHHNRVVLEDSLQKLAQLPEAERIERIKQVIEKEQLAQEKMQESLAQDAKRQEERERRSMTGLPSLSLGEIGDRSWYFYNATLMGRGKVEFQRTWGNRVLEDNWRRRNKVAVSGGFASEPLFDDKDTTQVLTENDTVLINQPTENSKELAIYLQQIPLSPAQLELSNKAIEEGLFQLIYIYKDKVEDYELAKQTYDELRKRFPQSSKLVDASFLMYQLHSKMNNYADTEKVKQFIIANYPESKYAVFLRHSDGVSKLQEIQQLEEKLYVETYEAFLQNNHTIVTQNTQRAQKEFPFSKLIPKFVFLDALSSGKKAGNEAFKSKLQYIVTTYPTSEITPLAKDMIALMIQGNEPQAGVSHGSLIAERITVVTEDIFAQNIQKAGFVYQPQDKHLFVILAKAPEQWQNNLIFELASYNFTRFLIKELDILTRKIDDETVAIAISGLDNLAEAIWYQNTILGNNDIATKLQQADYKGFVISETNFSTLRDKESLERYFTFYRDNNLVVSEQQTIIELQQKAGFIDAK